MAIKDNGKRILRRLFELGQRAGFDALPRHFYSSIPEIRHLRQSTVWRRERDFDSVAGAEIATQAAAFTSCFDDRIRSRLNARDVHADACRSNGAVGYGPIEAEVLYAYVAKNHPTRVVQVGAGVSTAVIAAAARDFGHNVEITCIDPFPTSYLRDLENRREISLLALPAQEVPIEVFTSVGAGGLLFVDSTHTVKPGSEVNRIVMDVLPRMPPGAVAHFHDITFPYDYAPDLLASSLFFWEESALLLAFLINNERAAIQFSMSMLHHKRADVVSNQLPRYQPAQFRDGIRTGAGHYPSSLFISFN